MPIYNTSVIVKPNKNAWHEVTPVTQQSPLELLQSRSAGSNLILTNFLLHNAFAKMPVMQNSSLLFQNVFAAVNAGIYATICLLVKAHNNYSSVNTLSQYENSLTKIKIAIKKPSPKEGSKLNILVS